MKKLAILVVACGFAFGAAACGKKKDTSTPATGSGDMGNTGGTGGDAYGGDAYGAPTTPTPEGNPCGGAANPCG
jgi:hypothetical protein